MQRLDTAFAIARTAVHRREEEEEETTSVSISSAVYRDVKYLGASLVVDVKACGMHIFASAVM